MAARHNRQGGKQYRKAAGGMRDAAVREATSGMAACGMVASSKYGGGKRQPARKASGSGKRQQVAARQEAAMGKRSGNAACLQFAGGCCRTARGKLTKLQAVAARRQAGKNLQAAWRQEVSDNMARR